jgi:hypothetical protein
MAKIKHGGFLALAAVIFLTPSLAHAQRGGGMVVGGDGTMYDTRSPEWKASGGNIFVYQQIMQQKMFNQQQQMFYKQQQQMLNAQRGKTAAPTQSTPSVNVNLSLSKKKKKKPRSYIPTGEVASKPATEKDTKSATSKPATEKADATTKTDTKKAPAGKTTTSKP